MIHLTLFTFVAIIIAYLLGSLSSAVIIAKIAGLPDPRKEGSHNPGATNMLRLAGKKFAVLTLLGDVLKGVIAVLIGRLLLQHGFNLSLIGIFAVVGHIYPVFFKFKGGKGVATGLGVMFALNPLLGLTAAVTWAIIAAVFRYSSLAALVTYTLSPFYALLFRHADYFFCLVLLAMLLFWRHRENIQRLKKRTEPKIGAAKSAS